MSPNNPTDEKSVGAWLHEVRAAKNLNLEQVSKNTRIHVNVLKSLEDDDVKSLGAVYVKSFLRLYAEYLGIDKDEVVRRYERALGEPAGARERIAFPGQPRTAPKGAPWASTALRLVVSALKAVPWKQVAIGAACLLLLWGITKAVKSHKAAAPAKKKTEVSRVAKSQGTRTAPAPGPSRSVPVSQTVVSSPQVPAGPASGAAAVGSAKTADKVVLIVKAKERTWIQVKVDGKVVFQSTLAKGAAERWQAREKINLWIGNAGSIQLELNGKLFERIGRPGQTLKNVEVTRSGLSIKR